MEALKLEEFSNFEYDRYGRLLYNPELHTEQGKPWSDEDLEYLCKFYDFDDRKSLSLALGRTETTISMKVGYLKKTKRFTMLKNRNKYW